MTLGVAYGSVDNLAALLSEAEDRRDFAHLSGTIVGSPSLTMDPTGGANYSGGSSYSAGMPLTASNAGLAGQRDIAAGAMSYEEAMDWTPSPLTQRISALKAGNNMMEGLDGLSATQSLNPMWYWLAYAGAAWWLWSKYQERRQPSW
jgi:hypothetical protein